MELPLFPLLIFTNVLSLKLLRPPWGWDDCWPNWNIQCVRRGMLSSWDIYSCYLDPCYRRRGDYCIRCSFWMLLRGICLASSSACGQDITLAADRVPSRLDFPLRFYRRVNDQPYCWCYSISWQWVLSWNESVCWGSSAGWYNLCLRDSIAVHRTEIGCEILSCFSQVDATYI